MRVLAADAMEGRGAQTRGLERAAAWIAREFRRLGLEAAGPSYFQPFTAIVGVEPGPHNTLAWNGQAAAMGKDFVPLGFSSSGAFEGSLVFAGYGIRAGELGYDDYAGLDVRGKVVLAMRYEPGEDDDESPFDGRRPSRWSDLRYKALQAREAGAAALVFVEPAGAPDEPDRLPPVRSLGPLSRAGLPVLQVTRELAEQWLAAAGRDLEGLREAIDASYAPASFDVPQIRLAGRTDVRAIETTLKNVVGVLPGAGSLAEEVVVIGAHYDHLGYGGEGSLRPGAREVHNGADDNASGVAAMLCGLASLEQALAGEPRRTVVAVAFAGEEIGLAGSGHYVKHPVLPLERTVAMINLDMVGRLEGKPLQALGADSSPVWESVLRHAAAAAALEVRAGGDGYGPSDQTSFYEAGIPVVHLFSGAHEQYHTPDDDPETLDVEGGARVVRFVAEAAAALARLGERPSFQASRGSGAPMMGDSRGYGAYLGTIPDYSEMLGGENDGVLLAGVRAASPADRAGLRKGDRIVEMAGVRIANLYDMTFVLRDHRPGQTVRIVVEREGERLSLLATLEDRRRASDATAPEGHGNP